MDIDDDDGDDDLLVIQFNQLPRSSSAVRKIHPKLQLANGVSLLQRDVQAAHQQCGQQLLLPAEADEELTETAAIRHGTAAQYV